MHLVVLRTAAIVLSVVAVASRLIAQTPVPIPSTTAGTSSTPCAVVGRVIDGTTGNPIRDAVVIAARPGMQALLTDANGRFAFDGLATGPVALSAMKAGHYGGLYGQRRPTSPVQSLQLADGERLLDVTLRLWKYAAIGGTVLDEVGEPVVGLAVWAYPKTLVAGRPAIHSSAGTLARTDDRGVFRIARLMPGTYVVGLPISENAVPLSMVEASAIAGYTASPTARSLSRGLSDAGMDGDLPGSTYLQVIDGQLRSLLEQHGRAPAARRAGPDSSVCGDVFPGHELARPRAGDRPGAGRRANGRRFQAASGPDRSRLGTAHGPRGSDRQRRASAGPGRRRRLVGRFADCAHAVGRQRQVHLPCRSSRSIRGTRHDVGRRHDDGLYAGRRLRDIHRGRLR